EAQKDADAATAASNAEKERIEKEYLEHITAANKLFDESKLQEARAEYEAAHALKSLEKYPVTRISRIDEMLAELAEKDENDEAEKSRLAEEERLKREQEAKNKLAEEEKLADAERQARLEKEKREAEEEAERKRREEERLEAMRREFNSNVDQAKEDEVEKYFREARLSEEHAKYSDVDGQKEGVMAFHQNRSEEAYNDGVNQEKDIEGKKKLATKLKDNAENEDALGLRMDAVNNEKDGQVRVMRESQLVNERNTTLASEKEQQIIENQRDYAQRSETMRGIAEEETENKMAAREALLKDDSRRQAKERKANEKKETIEEKQREFSTKGDAQRQINEYEVTREKKTQSSLADSGEKVRQESEMAINEKKKDVERQRNDLAAVTADKQASAVSKVENKKEASAEMRNEKDALSDANVADVDEQKSTQQLFYTQQNREASTKSFDNRDELFEKDRGGEKDPDDYAMKPGTETLAEGVTENSYQLGNKIVIERTLKIGNKVDYYKKVVSKTGIYYFKNDKAITEGTWDFETLKH
ncbi:MAG: hypothetical protein JNM00_08505, partial [Flavobacteriales bacterium]|nr:hypothetical protein [Flavobacteriales bacterium]